MGKITFDAGIQEYQVNGSVLRFNPEDPNLYVRIQKVPEKLTELEKELEDKKQQLDMADGMQMVQLLAEIDVKIKELLAWAFGTANDFDSIFDGVSCLASGSNGKPVIENFLAAILPVIKSGAERCAQQQIDTAVAQAKARRAAQ